MNPPFSALANVSGRVADAAYRHIASALARLADGGRLVAITGANFGPDLRPGAMPSSDFRSAARSSSPRRSTARSAKHGTSIDTRLTVIDKCPAADPALFPASAGIAPDVATLLGWIEAQCRRLPLLDRHRALAGHRPRAPCAAISHAPHRAPGRARSSPKASNSPMRPWTGRRRKGRLTDAIYEEYTLQSIRRRRAAAPDQAGAVGRHGERRTAQPSYRPMLPRTSSPSSPTPSSKRHLCRRSPFEFLAGSWTVDETFDLVRCPRCRRRRPLPPWLHARRRHRGQGPSVGIILDNWLRGRRKAVWISKSDKLIEDAQRDVAALGMERLLVTPLSRFPQGKPIRLPEGILFTTYATLRSDDRGEKVSRVRQIVEWLGSDFDGVIIFDESHAMQNAGGGKGERGDVAPSQQGRAGLRLQHALPARVVYVSATGATTVHNLAYAQRLGLWGGEDFLRHPRRVRRGDRGRRHRGDGGARPRPAALGLYRPLALL
jgi:hypothetical protein